MNTLNFRRKWLRPFRPLPLLLGLALGTGWLQATHPALISDPVSPAATHRKNARRSRSVRIRSEIVDALRAGSIDTMEVPTFDGETRVLKFNSRQPLGPGSGVWSAEVIGSPGSTADLVVTGSTVSLSMNILGRPPYVLRGDTAGNGQLSEVDLTAGGNTGCETCRQPRRTPDPTPSARRNATPAGEGADDPCLIDIVVLYTPLAREEAGGTAQIQAEVFKSLNRANGAHSISDSRLQFRLVHMAELSFTEGADVHADLEALAANTTVKALLAEYHPDLVSLFFERTGGSNGLAYSPEEASQLGGTYSVVKWDHAYSGMTFAHETGHSFGCGHDDGTGIFTYSRGYQMPPSAPIYRTIMANDHTGLFITRVPYYSNPDRSFFDGFTSYVTGNADTADNARTLRETRFAVRADQVPLNAYYTFGQCTDCATGQLQSGDAGPYSPAGRLHYLFDDTVATGYVGMITATGLEAATTANIYMDSSIAYPESVRITRPCRIEKWSGHGTGNVRIGAR